MMYCYFTTDGGAASQQIHSCIVISKNYFTSTVFYNTTTALFYQILVIEFHYNIVKSQTFYTSSRMYLAISWVLNLIN